MPLEELWNRHKTDNRMMTRVLLHIQKNPLLYVEGIHVHTMKVYVGVKV